MRSNGPMTLPPLSRLPGTAPSAVPSAPSSLPDRDRKSTRLNSSHVASSYAVFCLKKKHEQGYEDVQLRPPNPGLLSALSLEQPTADKLDHGTPRARLCDPGKTPLGSVGSSAASPH